MSRITEMDRRTLEALGKDGYVIIGLSEYEESAIRAALAEIDALRAQRAKLKFDAAQALTLLRQVVDAEGHVTMAVLGEIRTHLENS